MYWYTETLMMMFLSILGTVPEWGSDSLGVLLTTRARHRQGLGPRQLSAPCDAKEQGDSLVIHFSCGRRSTEGFKYENL